MQEPGRGSVQRAAERVDVLDRDVAAECLVARRHERERFARNLAHHQRVERIRVRGVERLVVQERLVGGNELVELPPAFEQVRPAIRVEDDEAVVEPVLAPQRGAQLEDRLPLGEPAGARAVAPCRRSDDVTLAGEVERVVERPRHGDVAVDDDDRPGRVKQVRVRLHRDGRARDLLRDRHHVRVALEQRPLAGLQADVEHDELALVAGDPQRVEEYHRAEEELGFRNRVVGDLAGVDRGGRSRLVAHLSRLNEVSR